MRRNLNLDERAYGVWQLLGIAVIIILVIATIGLVGAARGNPWEKKTYVKADVTVKGAEALGMGGAAITDTSTELRKQNYFDAMSMQDLAWWDPASMEVNIEMDLYEKVDGSMSQIDNYKDSTDLTVTDGFTHTFNDEMGPFDQDATSYEIEITITAEDGSTEDTKTISGTL